MRREDSGLHSSGWGSQRTLKTSKKGQKVASSDKRGKKTVTKVTADTSKKLSKKAPRKGLSTNSDKKALLSLSLPKHSKNVSKKPKCEVILIKEKNYVFTEVSEDEVNHRSIEMTRNDSIESAKHDDFAIKTNDSDIIYAETTNEQNDNNITKDLEDELNVSTDKVLQETFVSDSDKIAPDKESRQSGNAINNDDKLKRNESNELEVLNSLIAKSCKSDCSGGKQSLFPSNEKSKLMLKENTQNVATMQSDESNVVLGDTHKSLSENGSEEVKDGKDTGIGALFELIDSDGDGFITLDKLRRVSVQLGLNFTEEEMKEMIAEANPSDSGQVNFKEINTLLQETKVAMDAEQKLLTDIKEAFNLCDKGQYGMLHTFRLTKALRLANMYPTDKDVRFILKNLGYPIKISYRQFKKIAIEVSRTDNERLVAAFQYFDTDNTGFLSEEKLRQILLPAISYDFTKKDMNGLISDFSSDGKIDLEVFVAYLTGQEQYLSTAKRPDINKTALKLPAISETSTASSARTKQSHKKQ
ncbi:uncharacterized protein LOC132713493 [Ruditapes philippinarum]|uniref:uncharacterized protein LOC132713493 n=1 Tax=Ruditapes philippinarum TaxID=129788 RepID=UPI00295BD90F|nr:uncharacterized protein LOC132713493 [Ruditapes philippinarum]